MVAVLDQLAGLIRACRAEVDGHHRLHAGLAAPGNEFVGAELVALGREPGQVELHRPLLLWPHAVAPVVAGNEIAAGPAHDCDAEFLRQLQYISAEAMFVGGRMAGFMDAAIYAATQM